MNFPNLKIKKLINLLKIENCKLKIVLFLFGLIVLNLIVIKKVEALSITIIPPQLEIEVEPGQVVTKTLKVKNESAEIQYLRASTYDFLVQDDSGTPIIIEEKYDDNRWASSNWIQLSPTQIKLNPGDLTGIQMTIIVPDNASPGGKYAAVLYSPDKSQIVDQTGSLIDPRAGTLVYLKVKGDIKQDAKVTKFQLPSFLENGPINVLTTITNLSDIHITPVGKISVKNMFGQVVENLPLKTTNIFPYTSRDFENTLAKKWLFGRYQTQLTGTYGTTGQALLATAYIWVIPWKLILVLLAIIVILITILKLKKSDKAQPLTPSPSEDLKKKYSDKK